MASIELSAESLFSSVWVSCADFGSLILSSILRGRRVGRSGCGIFRKGYYSTLNAIPPQCGRIRADRQ